MIMIRRAVDRKRAYTVIMLPGEPAKWIPTSDYEHQRILEIYKQDKFYEGIENDFIDSKKKFPKLFESFSFDQYKQDCIRHKMYTLSFVLDKEKNYITLEE